MSAFLVALVAASPLVAASNQFLPRQAATTTASLDDYNPNQCVYPSTLATPTGYPTPPADLQSFLYSATDACQLNTAPASITSEFSSWTSAYQSWVTANSASLISLANFVSSYEASVATQSQCTQFYDYTADGTAATTMGTFGVDDLFPTDGVYGTCSTGGVAGAVSTSGSAGASSSATSASGSSSAASVTVISGSTGTLKATAATTLPGTVASTSTASSASGNNAGVPMARASGSVSAYFLIAGATVAVSTFIGMIAL